MFSEEKVISRLSLRPSTLRSTRQFTLNLIQGAKNKREVEQIEKALRQFEILHFNEDTSQRTIDLIRTYSKSHGLMFGDAIISAVALEHGLELVTLNAKHFRFIKGLKIQVPKL